MNNVIMSDINNDDDLNDPGEQLIIQQTIMNKKTPASDSFCEKIKKDQPPRTRINDNKRRLT